MRERGGEGEGKGKWKEERKGLVVIKILLFRSLSVCSPFSCVHVEQIQNFGPHSWGGCGSQCHDGYPREPLSELAQSFVVWTEVVTPLADAVSFINHKPCQPVPGVQSLEGGL